MTHNVPWNNGDGQIALSYTGEGNASVSVSSERNEGLDREQTLHVSTTGGDASADVTVRQNGMREPYECADSDDVYECADGDIYGAIKQEIV